ncbi:MAG: TolC family protein [Nitrospirota bacterium]
MSCEELGGCMPVSVIAVWGVLTICVGLVSCAATRTATTEPSPRPLGRDVPAFAAGPPARPEPIDLEEPVGAITVRQAVALALMRNPELQAFSWEARARDADAIQAGRLPNPVLTADLQDIGSSNASADTVFQPQANLTISQLIELGGKRGRRAEAAALARDLAGWEYERKRIEVITQVSQACAELLGAQEQLALADEMLRLAESVVDIVSARVRAGKVAAVEEVKAQVALSAARIERGRAANEVDAARGRLAATWGSMVPRFEKAEGSLGPASPIPPLSDLAGRLDQSPALSRWTADLAQRRAALDLERARAIPDLTVLGGYRRYDTTGDSTFTAGLSIPLPIFDRNGAGIQAARDRLAKGEAEQQAEHARVSLALAEAYRALSAAQREAVAIEERILPGAQSAFDAVNEGYRIGKFGLLDVFDAQRTWFHARSQHLRALINYRIAVADVEGLTGESLHGTSDHASGEE